MTAAKPKNPMTPVKSSAMTGYHIDHATGTLTIEFPSGDKWAYNHVTLERLTAFEGAASKGGYFAREIKPHHIGKQVG